MERIFKASALAAKPAAETVGYSTVPMRLGQSKVALVKKVIFYLEGITTSDAGYLMALFNRSLKDAMQGMADLGSYGDNLTAWYGSDQVIALHDQRFITSGIFKPFVVDIPPPYFPVISDLTLLVIGGVSLASTSGGVVVYYEQKPVTLEEWQRIAKEY